MITRRRMLVALALTAGAGPALSQPAAPGPVAEKLPVVATFSILADLVRQVGGERVAVTALVGPDGDAHVYAPTPADGKRLAAARLVVTNGFGFEGWIDRLIKASGTKAGIVQASRGVAPLRARGGEHGHAHGSAHDPHAWQNVANAKLYAAAIRDALVSADPAGREAYEANAAAYDRRLDALDAELRAAVARIPAERRRVITSHDAFTYFEAAYGLAFVAPQGVSTESEASAADVGRLIRQIRRENIKAIFVESVTDPRLVERIARETGARVGERVYSDALSAPDGPAGTYIDMMRHNIRAFGAALGA